LKIFNWVIKHLILNISSQIELFLLIGLSWFKIELSIFCFHDSKLNCQFFNFEYFDSPLLVCDNFLDIFHVLPTYVYLFSIFLIFFVFCMFMWGPKINNNTCYGQTQYICQKKKNRAQQNIINWESKRSLQYLKTS